MHFYVGKQYHAVVVAAAAELPAGAMRPASPRCLPWGEALTRREEWQLVGPPTIRRLSRQNLRRKEARESNPGWKRFSRTGASNQTRATRDGANLPCLPPRRQTQRRSMSKALSTTGHTVSERPTRRGASLTRAPCARTCTPDFLYCPRGKHGMRHHVRK